MRKYTIFIPYALWAIVCIVLKIMGASWWLGTSFLWLPAGVALSALTIIYGAALWGARLKEEKRKKEKPTCGNCLYEKVRDILKEEQCLGEKNEQVKTDGICPYWMRKQD